MEKVLFISILILQTSQLTTAKPFLINSLSSFLGVSGSASSAINPLSENIGAISQNKSAARVTDFENEFVFPEEATTTESQPNFIQKKVSKIIQKLVTLSQITAVLQGSTQQSNDRYQYPTISNENLNAPQNSNGQKETNLEMERDMQKQEPNKLNFEWTLDGDSKEKEANVFEFEWTEPKSDKDTLEQKKNPAVYGVPNFNLDQPLKINLKQNLTNANIDDVEIQSNSKEFPTSIGVYVLELFASIIGLAVGATNQINHSLNQNNTV